MRQGTGHRQTQQQSVTLRVDPRVLLSSQLLQLGHLELRQAVESELQENPALERLVDDEEPITDEAILRSLAPQELRPSSEDFQFHKSVAGSLSDEVDWTDFAASHDALADRLAAQLLPRLEVEHRRLGAFLIGSIDERGYFDGSLEEAALACECSLEEAEQVLAELQKCDPAGIGARTLQECLILQLRGDSSVEGRLARAMLRDMFEELRDRNLKAISRRYRVVPEVVQAAIELVMQLTPYPGETRDAHSSAPQVAAAVPDLILSRSEAGWEIVVPGTSSSSLAVSRSYRHRLGQLHAPRGDERDEKRHLTEYVQRAERFIAALDQRQATMRRIGQYLIEHQAGFVATGSYEFLGALTRTQLASNLGVHESTISRATMDKHVQIATGEVVPFEVFFKPALRVQKMIEEILSTENPDNPLSDERIAQMLAERGIHIARRTVNKYRDRTKLLSSRRRRTA